MNPKLIVINTIEGLRELQVYLVDKTLVAYDCETTGLTQQDQVIGFSICAEDDKAFYVILAEWKTNPNTLEQINDVNYHALAYEILHSLKKMSLIMHNGLFDCMMAESNFKIKLIDSLHTDTMLMAHLLNENRRVGLKELAAEMYGDDSTAEAKEMQTSVIINGGKWLKSDKEMYKADSQILGKYGAKDAWLTYHLFMDFIPQLETEGMLKFFYEDEVMPLLKGPTYELNTTGIQVNTQTLISLKNTLIADCEEAKSYINQQIQPYLIGRPFSTKFNLGSNVQLSWLLFSKLNLEFGLLTKSGKAVCKQLGLRLPYTASAKRSFIAECSRRVGEIYQPEALINGKKVKAKKFKEPWSYIQVDKKTLTKLAPKYKWIQHFLELKKNEKILSTYVTGIEDNIRYGVIKANYLQHGTKTGRYSCKSPNLQQLPRDDQRVKQCFVSRPGKVFVAADFSQLEPRTFASYSQDPKLMSAFDGTSDFYSVIGREVYDKYDSTPQKEGSLEAFGIKYKKLRDLSKVIALASAYGATANQLSPTTGKSIDETAEDMAKYFERFPGVKKMMLEAHILAKKDGFVTNIFGRKRRLPDARKITRMYGNTAHSELPYEARGLLNQACNFRIQSTGASIVNRAAIRFHNLCKEAGLECKLISQIHDELIAECSEQDAENISVLLREAMENTTKLPGVSLEAKPRITKTLAK